MFIVLGCDISKGRVFVISKDSIQRLKIKAAKEYKISFLSICLQLWKSREDIGSVRQESSQRVLEQGCHLENYTYTYEWFWRKLAQLWMNRDMGRIILVFQAQFFHFGCTKNMKKYIYFTNRQSSLLSVSYSRIWVYSLFTLNSQDKKILRKKPTYSNLPTKSSNTVIPHNIALRCSKVQVHNTHFFQYSLIKFF